MITYMIEVLKISHLQINRSIYNSLNKCYTSDIDIEIDIQHNIHFSSQKYKFDPIYI